MKTMQEWIADYAESKSSEIYQPILEQLQTVNKLWTAYSPVTKNHYMEYFQGRPTAFLFSERQFCESFRKHLQTHRVKIEPELCKTEDRLLLFSDLYRSGVEHILLDNGAGGTGRAFDWGLLRTFERPFFLAGGLGPGNAAAAVRALRPFAVDVSSGVETDGVKDREKMRAFVEAVRKASREEDGT